MVQPTHVSVPSEELLCIESWGVSRGGRIIKASQNEQEQRIYSEVEDSVGLSKIQMKSDFWFLTILNIFQSPTVIW